MPPSAPPSTFVGGNSPLLEVRQTNPSSLLSAPNNINSNEDEKRKYETVSALKNANNNGYDEAREMGGGSSTETLPTTNEFNSSNDTLSPYTSALGSSIGGGGLGLAASPFNTMFGSPGASVMGSAMYGSGMYGGPTSPFMNGAGLASMMPWGTPMMGPLSGLTQTLLNIQSIILSIGQAIQIVGMNADALQRLLESTRTIFEQAISTWYQHQAQIWELTNTARNDGNEDEDLELKKRRRRLRALRWTMVAAATWVGYVTIRKLLSFLFPKRNSGAGNALIDDPALRYGRYHPDARSYPYPPPPTQQQYPPSPYTYSAYNAASNSLPYAYASPPNGLQQPHYGSYY